MSNKMAKNSYPSKVESKKQTKQTRTETESQIWRAFRWLPGGRGVWKNRLRGEGIEKYKQVVTEQLWEHKYNIVKVVAEEFI